MCTVSRSVGWLRIASSNVDISVVVLAVSSSGVNRFTQSLPKAVQKPWKSTLATETKHKERGKHSNQYFISFFPMIAKVSQSSSYLQAPAVNRQSAA